MKEHSPRWVMHCTSAQLCALVGLLLVASCSADQPRHAGPKQDAVEAAQRPRALRTRLKDTSVWCVACVCCMHVWQIGEEPISTCERQEVRHMQSHTPACCCKCSCDVVRPIHAIMHCQNFPPLHSCLPAHAAVGQHVAKRAFIHASSDRYCRCFCAPGGLLIFHFRCRKVRRLHSTR